MSDTRIRPPREPGRAQPRLAVFKFASCDGCQLQVLGLDADLLGLAEQIDIAYFPEATSRSEPGPYDLALVEGSITTPEDVERIRRVRADSAVLVTIGACATSGGIQALRNGADVDHWKQQVYPEPGWLSVLSTSTPIADHVPVDHELHGCPIDKGQLLQLLLGLLRGATPALPGHSVCQECKRRGAACVMVARGIACLGPVTRAGCGALCPAQGRDCYGCFGPHDDPNPAALAERFEALGVGPVELRRRFDGITGNAPAFRRFRETVAVDAAPRSTKSDE